MTFKAPVLRIRHYAHAGDCLAEVAWIGPEGSQATVSFSPRLDRFDLEDIRWYHENYRQNWLVSSNSTIQRIQNAELNVGRELHRALFHGSALQLAANARSAGASLRIEIRDEVHGAAVPWELLADPETDDRLALTASSFVRTTGSDAYTDAKTVCRAPLRLLLVISRPRGTGNVGYWSVAYGLWRELARLPYVAMSVLRPPTFEALERQLDEAARNGTPYAAVHFDGHGAVMDPFGAGSRGYLLFDTTGDVGPEPIDGSTIGRTLSANGVLHFSMNACRSADSRGGDRNLRARLDLAVGQPSIVDEVLAEGVASCIGMREEIYPGTAARFFGAFYPALFGGCSAGDAARIARLRLREDPLAAETLRNDIAPVEDWSIPVVGERSVTHLRPAPRDENRPQTSQDTLPDALSAPPVVGFSRAIVALENALANATVVLVNGPLLSGKSRLAVEYARWLQTTSTTPCPVHYVRLSAEDAPASIATRLLPHEAAEVGACAEHLRGRGGILILDQADQLQAEAELFLADLLRQLDGNCRTIVTARAERLPWLPECLSVMPDALPREARAELGQRWAHARGARLESANVRALLFFSGGLPGMILLLLGAAQQLINRGAASAEDIAEWLHSGDWDRIADLADEIGYGLPTIEVLIGELVAHLSASCDTAELAMISAVSRFHVCCDEASAARLLTAARGTDVPMADASRTVGKLVAAGLATRAADTLEPTWFLHPLLKLTSSRLVASATRDDDDLQDAFVETVARKCADLAGRFRGETVGVVDMLGLFKQNMSDALHIALERGKLEAASLLIEGLGLHCRYAGDVDLLGRILNRALPFFVDVRTGGLRPALQEFGVRVWDQAIWLTPDWPRHGDPMRQRRVRLEPPDDDHYAAGLWLRATGHLSYAANAFSKEREAPAPSPRYAPGDLECQLSETLYDPEAPDSWPAALEESCRSYAARGPNDTLGRTWSRISEARIRLVMALNGDDCPIGGESDPMPCKPVQENWAQLEEIAAMLREAQSQSGGQSAENRAQAAMLWARIMLARGDLTSAIGNFEEGAELMMAMEEASIWNHYLVFAHSLVRHGWIAKGYEMAVNAFQFAMQTGDVMLPTRIRQFCQRLKDSHPELINDQLV